jgi:hypothetical protein
MGLTFFPPQGDNLPTGWSQAAQQSSGNTQTDQMMKVALTGYPTPQLYVSPASVYTQVGGSVPVACTAGQSAAGAGVLTRPAAFTITWALAGQSKQLGPFLKGSKQDPPASVTLSSVPKLPDVSPALRPIPFPVPRRAACSVARRGSRVAATGRGGVCQMLALCFAASCGVAAVSPGTSHPQI